MEELQLLTKFLDKMDGGLLPSRLSIVLSEMKAVLQSLPRQADEAWNKVEKRLQRSYRKVAPPLQRTSFRRSGCRCG